MSAAQEQDRNASGAPADRPVAQRRSRRMRIIGVLAAVYVALILGEGAVRYLNPGPLSTLVDRRNFRLSSNPILQYELVPGSVDGEFNISSAGLRDREPAGEKRAGVFRVAALGDSVTFGIAVARDESYPEQLEALLNRRFATDDIRFEVVNFGVTGYNVTQVAEVFRSRVRDWEPDLVIYGYVLNDPQRFSFEREFLRVLEREGNSSAASRFADWPACLLSHSRLYLLCRTIPLYFSEPTYSAHRAGSHEAFIRLLHTEDESRARVREGFADLAEWSAAPGRVPVLVALFPVSDGVGAGPYPLSDVHARVADEARGNGLAVLDLTDAYRAAESWNRDELFLDFLHPSALGYGVAARAMVEWMERTGAIPIGDGGRDQTPPIRQPHARIAATASHRIDANQ